MPVTDKELSDREFLEGLANRIDHVDSMAHEIDRKVTEIAAFIDEHRPALARGLALMGGGLGGWIGKRGKSDG